MKFLIWNVRGINSASKQKELKKYIRSYNSVYICLVKTKVKLAKLQILLSSSVQVGSSTQIMILRVLEEFGFSTGDVE